jgi:hypothetical protein
MSTASPSAHPLLRDPVIGGSWTIGVRVRTALNRTSLTAALAAGEDPHSRADLALRARQLTTMRSRNSIARSLEHAVRSAEDPRPRMSSAVPLARRDVRAARSALRDLVAALLQEGDVSPRGVALAERLLTDGTSPLYLERTNDALWRAVVNASEALRV